MDLSDLIARAAEQPGATLVVLGLAWLAWYSLACWVWPFAACGRCDGAGRHRSPSGKAWRRCKRCQGKGSKIRLGRRMWTGAGLDKLRQ